MYVLTRIQQQSLRNHRANSCLHVFVEHYHCSVSLGEAHASIWFGSVWFYGISTIVGYLMQNAYYEYILNIYDLVWFGFMAYQPL